MCPQLAQRAIAHSSAFSLRTPSKTPNDANLSSKPEPQTGRLARSASFLRLSTFLKQAASPSAPPEAKNFSSGSFPTRHAALRERGLRPKLSLSALEAELDRHIPPSYEHRSSDDGTTLSPAGQIKAQWEAKNKLEEERQGRVHTPVSQGPPVPPGLESVREVGSETSSSSTHGILEDEDMAIIGSLYPEALLPLPDSPSPSIHDPCLDSTIHDATLFAHDPQSKPNTIVSFRLHTESNKLPAPQISEVAASQRETPSSSPEARIPTPTPPHPIIEIRDVQCKPWVEETHKLPRLSSRLSMASLRRTVVGTLSRNKTTTFDEYNSHSSDAGMLLQTSPSLHVRCPTPIPSSDTSRFGPSPSFRAAIRPRMHTQGTILLGVAEIEDEETRRMTELAFM